MNGAQKLCWLAGAATLPFLIMAALGGCTTKSKADLQAQQAYLAGQQAAIARMGGMQRTDIVVVGPVQKPEIQWTNGLTLAQAIVEAGYNGFGSPKEIILTRRGETASISPQDLLNGHDVPLEPGDTITIR